MGDKLKAAMERRGLSQTELAEKTGVSQQLISAICNGWKRPSVELLKRIANTMKCQMEDLI